MSGKGAVGVLIAVMLVTGCSNSLFSKYQDLQCVENCDDPDPSKHKDYAQPLPQSVNMFMGEAFCMIAFLLLKSRLNPWRPPALSLSDDPKIPDHAGLAKAKYRATSQTDPDDSGVVMGDEQVAGSGSLVKRLTTSRVIKAQEDDAPFGGHGAVPAPIAVALEDDEAISDESEELKGWKQFLFALPTLCDCCGTTLMNVGLLLTPVSIYQMSRGSLPIWVALFSRIFLKRRIPWSSWISLLIISTGVAVVGWAGTKSSNSESSETTEGAEEAAGLVVLGVSLIFFAQAFTSAQFVLEEKIMVKYGVEPLRAVGLEGLFGLAITLFVMFVLHYTIGNTPQGKGGYFDGGYFDARTGWEQIMTHPVIAWTCLAIALSIAIFNFAGLAVTKRVSATARAIVDTCRSLGIWLFSLMIGWESFKSLQLLGFVLLVLGSLLFNGVVAWPTPILAFLGEDTQVESRRHHNLDNVAEGGSSGWRDNRRSHEDSEQAPLIRTE